MAARARRQVYMMAIDTVMLSFCEDCEAHGGEPRSAPPLLLHALHTAAAAEEERAAHRPGPPPCAGGAVILDFPLSCPASAAFARDIGWRPAAGRQGGRAAPARGGRPRILCRDGRQAACAQVGQEGPRGGRGDAGRPARDLGRQGAARPAFPRRTQVARARAPAASRGARHACRRARWLGRWTAPGGLTRARAREQAAHAWHTTHLPAVLDTALVRAHQSKLLDHAQCYMLQACVDTHIVGKQTLRVSLAGPPALPTLLPTATPRCALGRTARKGPAPTQATGREHSHRLQPHGVCMSCLPQHSRGPTARAAHTPGTNPSAQPRTAHVPLPLDGLDLEVRADEREDQALHVLPRARGARSPCRKQAVRLARHTAHTRATNSAEQFGGYLKPVLK